MTSRRQLIGIAATGALAPSFAFSQARPPRIGILAPRPLADSLVTPRLVRSLAAFGYRDGASMVLEYRSTDGVDSRAPKLLAELIGLKCDVIFVPGSEIVLRAVRDARSPAPVVILAFDFDPIQKGIVTSLSRPDGNMTGVMGPGVEIAGKKLEIALEVLPAAKRFLVLSDGDSKDQLDALRSAAHARGVTLTAVEYARAPYDLVAAFEAGRRSGVDAFIGLSSPRMGARRVELGSLFTSHRIPAFVGRLSMGEPGFLVAYTTNLDKLILRAAAIGVRILKGAKPVDIPIEQPDEFELVVNLKTAKALGLKIPYSVLARATALIE